MDDQNFVFTLEMLERMSRKEIQQVAKEHGLRANKSTADIIKEILRMAEKICGPMPHLEVPISVDEIETVEQKRRRVSVIFDDYKIGETVELSSRFTGGEKKIAVILRINKKTVRVELENGEEITVKFDEIGKILNNATEIQENVPEILIPHEIQQKLDEILPMNMSVASNEPEHEGKSDETSLLDNSRISGPFIYSMSMFSPITNKTDDAKRQSVTWRPSTAKKVYAITIYVTQILSAYVFHQLATPSSLKKPKIVPSSTKSQLLRQESSLLKKRNFQEIEQQVYNDNTIEKFIIDNYKVSYYSRPNKK